MVRRVFRRQEEGFLIQSQVMFIEVEMIVVQWIDWFHVRREGREI